MSLKAQTLAWVSGLDDGLSIADQTHRPLLALWIPSSAPGLSIRLQNLFSTFPSWNLTVSRLVVPTRLVLPAEAEVLGLDIKTCGLALLENGRKTAWQGVPPILDVSRAIAKAADFPLKDPYQILKTEMYSDKRVWRRQTNGPVWIETPDEGSPRTWFEEGPAGPLLLLDCPSTGKRAALPLTKGWSWKEEAGAWSAWEVLKDTSEPPGGQKTPKPLD